jgi:thiol-disulfide isomerase/thioredoxin
MTDGPVHKRMSHIDSMVRQFAKTDEGDPAQARIAQTDSSNAIIATAKSVLASDDLDEIDRNRAGKALFDASMRQVRADPEKYHDFVATCTELIERFPQSELATQAAFLRLNVLASVRSDDLNDGKLRLDRVFDATMSLADQKPPHTNTPDVLTNMARELERSGEFARSAQAYAVLVGKFPDPEKRRFAPGHLRRVSLVGQPIGELRGADFDEKEVTIEQFRGKVVLIDFWASWCEPCTKELPEMKKLYERLGPKGLEILAINCDDNHRAAIKMIKDRQLTWPQIVARNADESDDPENNLEIRFGIEFLPTKLVVDRDGTVVWSGFLLPNALQAIEKLFPADNQEDQKPSE